MTDSQYELHDPRGAGFRDVEVWAIPLRQPPDVVAALLGDLDAEERPRAGRDPRYGVAHGAARRILAAQAGCAAHELRRTAGPHGKPRLVGPGADLAWNLSASGDWALLAVIPPASVPDQGVAAPRGSSGGRPVGVGVDVQQLVPDGAALRLAARYFGEAEARQVASPPEDPYSVGPPGEVCTSPGELYTRLWTYKEAYVKAFGGRLMQGLAVPAPTGPGGTMDGPLGRCRVTAVPGPAPGCPAAVAVTGELPPRPVLRTWKYAPAQLS
jgi:4'-phosphopantetheinyl transferase